MNNAWLGYGNRIGWRSLDCREPRDAGDAGRDRYRYTLSGCNDDQPIWHRTAHGITTATGVFDQVAGFLPGIILGDAG